MAERQNRWVLNIILGIAVLSLIGFSMIPLINATLQAGQQPETPTPTAAATPLSAEARRADLEAQIRGYELVLQREPENLTALQGVLEARLDLLQSFNVGDAKALIDPLEKLARLKAEDPRYLVLLAQTKEYLNDREGAAQAYRNALNQHPGDPFALTGFVNLYLKQKQPEAALGLLKETLDKATQLNKATPGTVNATTVQVLLGEVYTQLQKYPDAIATFELAIATDPLDFRPQLGKARVLLAQEKSTEAKAVFEQAFKLAPASLKDAIRQERDKAFASATAPTTASTPASTPAPGKTAAPTAATAPANSPSQAAPATPSPAPSAPTQSSAASPAAQQ